MRLTIKVEMTAAQTQMLIQIRSLSLILRHVLQLTHNHAIAYVQPVDDSSYTYAYRRMTQMRLLQNQAVMQMMT